MFKRSPFVAQGYRVAYRLMFEEYIDFGENFWGMIVAAGYYWWLCEWGGEVTIRGRWGKPAQCTLSLGVAMKHTHTHLTLILDPQIYLAPSNKQIQGLSCNIHNVCKPKDVCNWQLAIEKWWQGEEEENHLSERAAST